VSPSLTDFLLRRRSRAESLASHKPGLDDLTVAEKRILKRVAVGKTNKKLRANCSSARAPLRRIAPIFAKSLN